MKLVIAEKPSLGKAIATWLTLKAQSEPKYRDYKVTWLFGHMLKLVEPEIYDPKWKSRDISLLPIIPAHFKLQITNNPGIKAQVAKVKLLYNESTEVLHAGDPDREGQLLVDELLEFFGNKKPVFRLWLPAIDDKSIERAFNAIKPNSEYLGYKLAAETRSRADWLVGINYSRALNHIFRKNGYSNPVSIGRVQTATLKLITDRDNKIKNFVSNDFYEIFGVFSDGAQSFEAKLVLPESIKLLLDENGQLLDSKPLADIALKIKDRPGIVSSYTKENKSVKQPLLFNLSELQAVANKKFGYSAKEVLDIAQTLYENKLTSYPRSDCQFLPESQFMDAPGILKAIHGVAAYSKFTTAANIKSQVWNDKKITAHHAIIPTGANLACLDTLKPQERNVFDLLILQYLMQFYPEAVYENTSITIDIEGLQFSIARETIQKWEWKSIGNHGNNNVCNEEIELLPEFSPGQKITCTQAELITKKTQKASPYTEGTLIKSMENIHTQIESLVKQQELDESTTLKLIKDYKASLKETSGLGTEATRANVIETLKKRGFIATIKKSIIATEFGHLLIDVLTNNKTIHEELGFLTSPLTTAEYEQFFNEIQTNKMSEEDFFRPLYQQLDRLRNFASLPFNLPTNSTINSILIKCPSCNKGNLNLKNGTKGKFWGCSEYGAGCKATYSDNHGTPILIAKPPIVTTGEKCPKCGVGYMVQRMATLGAFKACNAYPKCKFIDKVR